MSYPYKFYVENTNTLVYCLIQFFHICIYAFMHCLCTFKIGLRKFEKESPYFLLIATLFYIDFCLSKLFATLLCLR